MRVLQSGFYRGLWLLANSKKEMKMARQAQCPNCHNYRVTKPDTWVFGCLVIIISLIAYGYLALGLLTGSLEILVIVLGITVGIFLIIILIRNQQPWVCKNCGFKWKPGTRQVD